MAQDKPLYIYEEIMLLALRDEKGTIATASGTLPGFSIHQLAHINDGRTGNDRSWISNTPGQGWIILEFPSPQPIQRIIWGRDHSEQFRDRLPIEYSFAVSSNGKDWQTIADSHDRIPFQEKADPFAFVEKLPSDSAKSARNLIKLKTSLETQLNELKEGPKAWVANFSKPPISAEPSAV